jgi:TatD DNase family protein
MWIDTHCHLVDAKLEARYVEFVQNAKQNSLSRILNIAYNPITVTLALEQCQRKESENFVFCAIGIQPHDSNTYSKTAADEIEKKAITNVSVAAIGEIGLDNFHKIVDMNTQIECFEHMLEIALRVKLPVVVHVRETHNLVYERLSAFSSKGGTGVVHCFTGSWEEAAQFLELGFFISFSGIVTFKNSLSLQEVARRVPLEKILVETDSPYLSPVPFRGKLNEPANVVETGKFIANLRNLSSEEFASVTTANALRLFSKMNVQIS